MDRLGPKPGLDFGPRLGVVTGLEAEARLARRLGAPVEAGGGTADGARAAAERLIRAGVRGLLSFGLAGGLDPALRPGDVLVPERVLSDSGSWATDPALRHALGRGRADPVFGGGTVLATAAAKRDLHARTGAAAVDLESAEVAEVAQRYGLPFAVLRAVCDPAHRDLPLAALVALDGGGRIGMVRVLRAVAARPREVPALLALGADAARARRSLAARVRRLRPGPAAPR